MYFILLWINLNLCQNSKILIYGIVENLKIQ